MVPLETYTAREPPGQQPPVLGSVDEPARSISRGISVGNAAREALPRTFRARPPRVASTPVSRVLESRPECATPRVRRYPAHVNELRRPAQPRPLRARRRLSRPRDVADDARGAPRHR